MSDKNSIEIIRIDGMPYTVETIEVNALGNAIDGQIDYSKLKVTLKDNPPQVWLQTMWHELLHHVSSYRLHDQGLSEHQIDTIASSINQILLDNPEIPLEYWNLTETGEFTVESDDDEGLEI
jgi:hypothetical protein